MNEKTILSLLHARSERVLEELNQAYGRLSAAVAGRILKDSRDVEECVSDAMLRVWNHIPPDSPDSLAAYISRITRNIALDRLDYNSADKRNSALENAYEELESCLPSSSCEMDDILEQQELSQFINGFLERLPQETRIFFVRRYWYGESIREMAAYFGIREEKIRTQLFRARNKMREAMRRENFAI